ncbi:MAG: hypothetical protein GY950_31490 [bacterium]|nr:hypothetical protein [bacterium]
MKQKLLTILFGLFMVLTVSTAKADAIMFCNDMLPPFPDGKSETIEKLVTEGASFYFKASAQMMALCAEAEILPKTDYNISKSLLLVRSVLGYMKESRLKYLHAAQVGITAGYVSNRLSLLKTFSYDSFSQEQGLNERVKNRVKGYLTNGDVTGFYQAVAIELEGVITVLQDIEKSLQSNTPPPVTTFWTLLQKHSELTLMGNYGTVMAQTAFGN